MITAEQTIDFRIHIKTEEERWASTIQARQTGDKVLRFEPDTEEPGFIGCLYVRCSIANAFVHWGFTMDSLFEFHLKDTTDDNEALLYELKAIAARFAGEAGEAGEEEESPVLTTLGVDKVYFESEMGRLAHRVAAVSRTAQGQADIRYGFEQGWKAALALLNEYY